jgi:hypothetical protein
MTMMSHDRWYRNALADEPLTQGDIIFSCPVVGWRPDVRLDFPSGQDVLSVGELLEAQRVDVIVMTQVCDLEHSKVRNIVLRPLYTLTNYKAAWESVQRNNSQNPTAKAWKRYCDDICNGAIWNLSLLNAESVGDLACELCVVDFHEVFTFPRQVLESLLKARRKDRPQLLPPYREHLSQSFARFFMRVGLPTPVTHTW